MLRTPSWLARAQKSAQRGLAVDVGQPQRVLLVEAVQARALAGLVLRLVHRAGERAGGGCGPHRAAAADRGNACLVRAGHRVRGRQHDRVQRALEVLLIDQRPEGDEAERLHRAASAHRLRRSRLLAVALLGEEQLGVDLRSAEAHTSRLVTTGIAGVCVNAQDPLERPPVSFVGQARIQSVSLFLAQIVVVERIQVRRPFNSLGLPKLIPACSRPIRPEVTDFEL
jgi:hypothetical protein